MLMMVHAFAYFIYDSIVEVYYGTDDLLTNLHHVCVVTVNFFHLKATYSGYEFIGKYYLIY